MMTEVDALLCIADRICIAAEHNTFVNIPEICGRIDCNAAFTCSHIAVSADNDSLFAAIVRGGRIPENDSGIGDHVAGT